MNAMADSPHFNLPSTARSDRIYAIGDIHGRYDLLKLLLEMIGEFDATLPKSRSTRLVFLGDMIDRGADSAKVLQHIHGLSKKGKVIALLGNHEELMLRAIDGEAGVMRAWLRFGGKQTLRSFGIVPTEEEVEDAIGLGRRLRKAMPSSLLEWLRSLPISARSGDYLFCHAGIRPGVEIDRQSKNDLIWIRDDFLSSDESHGVVVVHGHSISADVEVRHNRIGIDTGAYRTDNLTAVYLEGQKCGIIGTADAEDEVDAEGEDVLILSAAYHAD